MAWLEVIEIRSVGINRTLLESQLQKLIEQVDRETEKKAIKAYSRVIIDTDFSIHLYHDSKIENSGSALGLQIASALKEFGWVNHSVWIEIQGN